MLTPEAMQAWAVHKPERILLIEDEEVIREAIAESLRQESYEVLIAQDGETGLEMLLHHSKDGSLPIDLLILDLMLPIVDGLTLCRLLRGRGNNIPILIISAKSSEADRVTGLDLGADDYLPKPFGLRELVARCRSLLRRCKFQPQTTISPVLKLKDIVLNPETSIVHVRGNETYLSPREFRLLEFFMQNPHHVWSREQLIKRVWGTDFVGDSKTLDVHIRWLREKLEVDPSQPQYIVTVRGFGYRFG